MEEIVGKNEDSVVNVCSHVTLEVAGSSPVTLALV
jgi:hypothetical protein